jgi:hypothetical protein
MESGVSEKTGIHNPDYVHHRMHPGQKDLKKGYTILPESLETNIEPGISYRQAFNTWKRCVLFLEYNILPFY